MIIFSDLHLCEKTADTVFNQVLPGLKEAALTDKDKTLLCLGDFYHIRYKVDVDIQNKVFEYFTDLYNSRIEVLLLPGNHDQINNAGGNALRPFDEIGNVCVFSEFASIDLGTFIPYRRDKLKIASYLKDTCTFGNSPIFIHQGIQGFSMNGSIVDKDGLDKSVFGDSLVICGHYHKRQTIGNICYVGSPYQIDAGEAGQDKGYCTFVDGVLSYVTTDWGIKYHNVGAISQGGNIVVGKPGDIVRVKAPTGVDLAQFRKSLTVPDGVDCVVEPTLEDSRNRLGGDLSSLSEYAEAYVNKFSGTLDKGILMDTFRQIGNQA